jgi:O-antigen/teichoic acid export membrane protein
MNSIRLNAAYKFMLSFFNVAVPMLLVPYLFRVLGPESIGEIEFSQSVFGYFFVVASLGMYSYGMREVSSVRDNPKKASKLFSELFVISAVSNTLGFIAFSVFVFLKPEAPRITPIMYILSFNFISNIFLIEWVNESLENYRFIAIKTVAIRILSLAAVLLLIRSNNDYLFYVGINAGYALFNNLVSYFYIRNNFHFTFTGLSFKKHIKPLLFITVMTNGWVLYGQLDKTFLGAFSSMTQVAYYSSAGKVIDILFPLLMSVTAVSTPRLAYYLQNSKSKYRSLVKRISGFSLFIVFPSATGIFLLSDEIMRILGAEKFAGASTALKVFAVYMIVLTVERIYTHNVLFVHRKEKALNVLIIGFGFMNAVSKIFLIPVLSGVTAILSTLVFHTGLGLTEHFLAKKRLCVDTGIFDLKNIRYVILSLLFVPVVFVIKKFSPNIFITAGAGAIICAGMYFIILVVMKDVHALSVKRLMIDALRRGFRLIGVIS